MGTISKAIVATLGLLILFGISSNLIGSHDTTSNPSIANGSSIGTKIAYTQDGQHFVSKERVEQNIKCGYSKPGDFKEVRVPLSTRVAQESPEDTSEYSEKVLPTIEAIQNKEKLTMYQKSSDIEKEWIDSVLSTYTQVSQEIELLVRAESNYQFDEIQRHSDILMQISDNALESSESFEVSPQYEASKKSYENAMREINEGCNEVLGGLDEKDIGMMYGGKNHIINGKNNFDNVINLIQQ